jgi:hypothetical protein
VGEYLKATYAELLPSEYSIADIKIRSTFKNRTYLSALYQIMGMYKEAVPSLTDRAQQAIIEDYLSEVQLSGKGSP